MSPRLFADQTIAALLETAAEQQRYPLHHYTQALVDALDELYLTHQTRIPMSD